jgi:ATP-dependent Clp protease ATP-binding subunit ClpX
LSTLKHQSCDFCGKSKDDVEKMVVGQNGSICNECVSLCDKILKDQKGKVKGQEDTRFNPVRIKEFLDEFVIGQDEAKIALSVGVSQHYKRISAFTSYVDLDKSNVMLIGPSGSGKTLMVKKIAEYIDVPFAHCDATALTEAGYVGEDVETLLQQLIARADGDIESACRGIIYIDEIDKISKKGGNNTATKDVGGEGVQQALLKMIEGSQLTLTYGKKKEEIDIDTKNILFIVGGSFVGIEKIVADRVNPSSIGFSSQVVGSEPNNMYNKVDQKDLIKYGLIPEFIGRFSILTNVEELSKKDLVRILTEPRNNLVNQYKYLFEIDGIELEFEPEALEEIAEQSILSKTNARGLRSTLEKLLIPYQFEAQDLAKKGLKKIVINKESVSKKELPIFVFDSKKKEYDKKL